MGAKQLNLLEQTIKVDLVIALPEDLKEFSHYRQNSFNETVRVMKLRHGIPYWLRSQVTGEIEPRPYILNEHTDAKELSIFLEQKMIFIIKDDFKDV
jgi:hypothetical protein